jgi:hypothetical protein
VFSLCGYVTSEGVVCCLLALMIRIFVFWAYKLTSAKPLTYGKSKSLFFLAFFSGFNIMKCTSNKNCLFERAISKICYVQNLFY